MIKTNSDLYDALMHVISGIKIRLYRANIPKHMKSYNQKANLTCK